MLLLLHVLLVACRNRKISGGGFCLKRSLSPRAESFLVLMILAAYSWPVQSLTQRRTTEKAPLGGKKKTGDRRMRWVSSTVSITLT